MTFRVRVPACAVLAAGLVIMPGYARGRRRGGCRPRRYLVIVGTALALVLAAWGLTFLPGARATAVLAVLGYRLVSYWLPLPAGAVAYLRIKPKGSPR